MDLLKKPKVTGEPQPTPEDLDFNVMPNLDAPPPPDQGQDSPGPGKRLWLVAGSALALIILAILGYAVYWKWSTRRSEPKLQQTIQVPPSVTKPADSSDTDKDGLTNAKEQELGTKSDKPDTDGDGIADGDEVNIYHSDPLLTDTDGDKYDDGQEVANGYSPKQNTTEKASANELKEWADNIAKFSLHEPTPTTLKLKAPAPAAAEPALYKNKIYGYSVSIPAILASRETDAGREVGIYIAGTTPGDTEVATDPIWISTAVKVPTDTLKTWVNSQYPVSDYTKIEEAQINGADAIKLMGVKSETCAQDKTFFIKGDQIVIISWTCNELSSFSDYYTKIISSFKFVQ